MSWTCRLLRAAIGIHLPVGPAAKSDDLSFGSPLWNALAQKWTANRRGGVEKSKVSATFWGLPSFFSPLMQIKGSRPEHKQSGGLSEGERVIPNHLKAVRMSSCANHEVCQHKGATLWGKKIGVLLIVWRRVEEEKKKKVEEYFSF